MFLLDSIKITFILSRICEIFKQNIKTYKIVKSSINKNKNNIAFIVLLRK